MNQPVESIRQPTQGLPPEIAEVSLLTIKDVCAAVRMSVSWVHEEVRAGRFPQPLRHGPRCTRWRSSDIRRYLVERASAPQGEIAAHLAARAGRASAAAKAKRCQALDCEVQK